jgi:hypothetical protein
MYRGRYQIGDEIPLSVLCTDHTGKPTDPDACPQLEIYGPTGKVAGGWPGALNGGGQRMPILDPNATTGFFQSLVFLGSMFSVGQYTATSRWTVGSFNGLQCDTFEIVPGGSDKGNVVALDWYPRPQASFLFHQLDSGRIRPGRNPRL